MPFTRPSGYYTTRFVDDQKRNPFEMLKHFLFDNSSGRTDVLFIGERNTYFQDPARQADLVGGLADGIAKALLTSTEFSTRSLYATPIYWGYHGNAPGIGYNASTFNWSDDAAGNPEGNGRCLVGTRYGFDSYIYTRNTSNQTVRLPLNAEKNNASVSGISDWFLPLFTTPSFYGNTLLQFAWSSTPFNAASYNEGRVNTGPISFPQFLGEKVKHILKTDISLPTRVGIYDVSTNIITEWFIDATTLAILRNNNIAANEKFPNTVNIGDNISTLDNRFTCTGGTINFACKITDFLIPILQHKGWSVCSSGCTGNEDAYLGNYYIEGGPQPLWVLNRHLPYSYGGQGNEFLFADYNTSQYFTKYKFGFVSDKQLTGPISSLYNGELDRGLPTCIHYTRVPWMGLCMGSDNLKINYEFGPQFQSPFFEITFDKLNIANQKISSYFIWRKNWESETPIIYKKEKKIILSARLGTAFDSYTTSPSLSITTKTPPKASLYTTNAFAYKVKYLELTISGGTPITIPNNLSKLAITISKRVSGVWTNLVDTLHTFSPIVIDPSPPARKYLTTTIDLTLPANIALEYGLSFTGFNSANRLEGDNIVVHHWGEDNNNTNGISFSHLFMSEDFRSGDIAYSFQSTLFQQQVYEMFDSIKERQKNNPNGKKKVVIAIPCLRFENANPGDGYIGGWSQTYFSAIKQYVLDVAVACGFTQNEVVVWFIGPMFGPKVDYWSNEVFDYSIGVPRATYQKSRFVMVGTAATNPLGGLLKATLPYQPNTITDTNYLPNAVYTDLEEVSALNNIKTSLSNALSQSTYSWDDGETSYFHTPSVEGFLVMGHELVKSVQANVSSSYFAPPWVINYGLMLNYENDPVNEAPFAFATPSLDPVDIRPYLVAFDAICDNSASPFNVQAKRTLNKFKTKILQ